MRDHARRDVNRVRGCAGVGLLALLIGSGCAAPRPNAVAAAAAAPADGGELMGAEDRARLERVAVERAAAPGAAGYQIGPDDLLEIRIPDLLDAGTAAPLAGTGAALPVVAQAPAFQQGVRVSAAGDVTIPLLGTVRAAGLTPTALQADLVRRLSAAGILRNPQVTVLVSEYRSRVVAVVGSVERPGLYPLTRPGATLADLVWAAGGPTRDAGRVVSFVPAAADTAIVAGAAPDPRRLARGSAIRLDLELLLHATAEGGPLDPPVRPGDLISVSPAGNVQVSGWVDKPGSYPVTRALTLSGAVAAAGGQLFAADRRHASVKRVLGPGDQRQFTVDLERVSAGELLDLPIADGDVVTLPPSMPRMVPYAAWELVKAMVHVGASVPLF